MREELMAYLPYADVLYQNERAGGGGGSGGRIIIGTESSIDQGLISVSGGSGGNNGNGSIGLNGENGVITFDITAPTMTITAAEGADGFTSNDATISLTFTSSEATTNFATGDITVTKWSLEQFFSNLQRGIHRHIHPISQWSNNH